jgi:hypothetical protein
MKSFRHFMVFIVFVLLFTCNTRSLAQPPPPSGGHGIGSDSPPGGGEGAPIGEGLFFLIGLAAVYGGKKMVGFRNRTDQLT